MSDLQQTSAVTEVQWEVPQPNYNPVVFDGNSDADPSFEELQSLNLRFNQFDRSRDVAVNRISHLGPYHIVNGLPRCDACH